MCIESTSNGNNSKDSLIIKKLEKALFDLDKLVIGNENAYVKKINEICGALVDYEHENLIKLKTRLAMRIIEVLDSRYILSPGYDTFIENEMLDTFLSKVETIMNSLSIIFQRNPNIPKSIDNIQMPLSIIKSHKLIISKWFSSEECVISKFLGLFLLILSF